MFSGRIQIMLQLSLNSIRQTGHICCQTRLADQGHSGSRLNPAFPASSMALSFKKGQSGNRCPLLVVLVQAEGSAVVLPGKGARLGSQALHLLLRNVARHIKMLRLTLDLHLHMWHTEEQIFVLLGILVELCSSIRAISR